MPHAHPEREKSSSDDSLVKGLVMGAVVGAGILWLLGTESGKKVKKKIKQEGEEILHKTEEKVENFVTEREVSYEDEDEVAITEPLLVPQTAPITRSKPKTKRVTLKKLNKTPIKTASTPKRFFRKKR